MKSRLISFCCLVLLLQACLKDEVGRSNQEMFQFIWDEMDQNYGGFIVRKVNWDSIYTVYSAGAVASTSDEDLWKVSTEMLEVLDDGHIKLYDSNDDKSFSPGRADRDAAKKEFDISMIKETYLENFTSIPTDDEEFIYGHIRNENIGYIHLPNFEYDGSNWHEKVDDAVHELKETDGLLIDLRNNGGGSPLIDRFIASRFVVEEKFVFSIQTRNGEGHRDFDEATLYYASPEGDFQYVRPIVILTNHSTISAGEEFLLFLETQGHITIVGDTTSNALSSEAFERLLPNGWEFGFPNQLYTYPDGSSPEGIGIIPDLYIRNDTLDIQNGIDQVLEKGIRQL